MDRIVEFAKEKFLGNFQLTFPTSRANLLENSLTYDAQTVIAAALDIRFSLSPDTSRLLPAPGEQKQVSSHLRLILTIPEHRKYMHTGFGSEPLVAEAASQLLRLELQENMVKSIEIADELFGTFLSAKGDRGEFTARLLLSAAHDRAVRLLDQRYTSQTSLQLLYTRPVGVLDFLKCLFAEEHHNKLLQALPMEQRNGEFTLEKAFSNAYVNFTHFCRAEKKDLCHLRFAWQGLVRSVAIQCCQTQEGVDIIIPIAFATEDNRPELAMLGKSSVSAIVIQVKDRNDAHTVYIDLEKLKFFKNNKGKNLNERPYISIVLELGLVGDTGDKPIEVTTIRAKTRKTRLDEKTYEHPQYNIVANGFHGVYKDISRKEDAILRKILHTSSFKEEYEGTKVEKLYKFRSIITGGVGIIDVIDEED